MNVRLLDPGQFSKIMALSQPARADLLEFLGATPVAESQIDRLIDQAADAHRPCAIRTRPPENEKDRRL